MVQTPQDRYQAALGLVLSAQSNPSTVPEAEREARELSQNGPISPPPSVKTTASPSPPRPALRNPANRLWTKATQRETFVQHLRCWASDHDSSVHFHGSISLRPRSTVPAEIVELGRSVSCLLLDASSSDPPTTIIIRLYQSKRCRDNAHESRQKDCVPSFERANEVLSRPSFRNKHDAELSEHCRSTSPYQLVVRSGSGWVTARQYFDKYHFNKRAKTAMETSSRLLVGARAQGDIQQRAAALPSGLSAHPSGPVTHIIVPMGHLAATLHTSVFPGWIDLRRDNPTTNSRSASYLAGPGANALTHRGKSAADKVNSDKAEAVSGKDVVQISPVFRPFTRLPQELQDEILYHAIGYTGTINTVRTVQVKDGTLLSRPPTTISRLFRISKTINEHMRVHIFRSTNFHFGLTGFTNFLWQIGPINRTYLQNLTFRFGKTALLHCVRWLAPDPVWGLFEPPCATSPPTLTYFWRCQLQDLVNELKLSTLTIDIRDVPLADVPMLVRILKSAVCSTQHIRIIDSLSSEQEPRVCNQALHRRFPDFQEATWRELSLEYHANYKHRRWHMRSKLTQRGADVRALMDECMDQNRAFFDA